MAMLPARPNLRATFSEGRHRAKPIASPGGSQHRRSAAADLGHLHGMMSPQSSTAIRACGMAQIIELTPKLAQCRPKIILLFL
jgi:hypothetical protein